MIEPTSSRPAIETRPRLGSDSSELRSDGDLARAKEWLWGYRPPDADQTKIRDEILEWIRWHPRDAHLRTCLKGHLTASSLVVDEALEHVILLHHLKLGRWLQPGGHCDGDANLAGVAWREANEETGIDSLEIVPRILDVDIHDIPELPGSSKRPVIPAHRHLDTRFLMVAPRTARPRRNSESRDVRWFDLQAAQEICEDASLARMLRLIEAHHELYHLEK